MTIRYKIMGRAKSLVQRPISVNGQEVRIAIGCNFLHIAASSNALYTEADQAFEMESCRSEKK